ncbi:MAG TPA: UrcA family protein [Novosphingobium sp.]|nr:UrcA family protein [Novosphingobium sp.]
MFKLLASAAALAAATIPAAASADDTQRSVEVRYDDLNLESDAGQARLDQRIAGAVRSVCGVANGPQSIRQRAAQQACARDARNQATLEVATRMARGTRLGG